MKKYMLVIIAAISCLMVSGCSLYNESPLVDSKYDPTIFEQKVVDYKPVKVSSTVFDENIAYWLRSGYSNMIEYRDALAKMNKEAVGRADDAVSRYSSVLSDEQREKLYLYEDRMVNASCIDNYNKYSELFDEIVAECSYSIPVETVEYSSYSYESGSGYEGSGGGLTMSQGVNNYNGRRETWYSSNVLYHYRTGEWTPDSNGVYRDSDGYVVVAASDLPQGSTVETSHGTGKVYDSGCAAGTTDIYTNW